MKRKIIGIVFLIIGIAMIGLHFGQGYLLRSAGEIAKVDIKKIDAEQMSENNDKEVTFDGEDVDNVDVIDTIVTIPELTGDYIIGQLYIPDYQMNMAVVKGITQENLFLGAGTMKEDQVMGEGNYTLAGHYSSLDHTLFNDVLDMEIGTDVYLTDKQKIYHYVIYSREIYPDDAFYMLEDARATEHGTPIISLMTCNVSSKSGQRVFAVGELVETTNYEDGIEAMSGSH